MKTTALFTLFLITFSSVISLAQTTNKSDLKINEIMKGKDFIGYWPGNVAWHVSGNKILFDWNPDNEIEMSRYTYSLESKKIEKTDISSAIDNLEYDKTQENFIDQYFTFNGNLWVYDKTNKICKELIASENRIFNIQRLNNKNKIAFQQDINLFLYDKSQGATKQLTFFQRGKESEKKNETTELNRQQEELFQFIREEQQESDFQEARKPSKSNRKIYLDKKRVDFLTISKDGNYVMIRLSDNPDNKNTQVEHHISKDGYSYSSNSRPKVGEKEPTHSFSIFDLAKDSLFTMNFDALSNIRKKPSYLKEYGDNMDNYAENRKIIMHNPIQSNDGKIVMDIRSYDNKDRWIIEVNPASNNFQEIDNQHDEAWIGGPGISSWNMDSGVLGFYDNDKKIYFQSERTGFSHLYSYDFQSKKTTALTDGKYEILDVQLAKNKSTFYLGHNKQHPGDISYLKYETTDKKTTEILSKSGGYSLFLSPNESKIAYLYSDKTSPWELFLTENKVGNTSKQITQSKSKKFSSYSWMKPEVISFKSEDNQEVFARLYKPEITENKPAVIFVHGAGYLQNAHNYWSNYYREFMFHNLLKDNGFTVLDIDFRASAGYGRDFRTAIYRHMGGADLDDQISGKKYLIDKFKINPEKVGIYGGSYGGFITLMALLTKPNEFACGAALRSVTDWMHYNHEYTSNILNYPNTDSIAYRQSSPIYFAENLNKPLLMLHGMVDDNVQFQDVVRLSQRFIELEKTNWELAVFPVEGHGFQKPYSWTDEYRRIFELFMEELMDK
jgi:dipeptidyl aminopeptidase/acylaminoacyl peptidase